MRVDHSQGQSIFTDASGDDDGREREKLREEFFGGQSWATSVTKQLITMKPPHFGSMRRLQLLILAAF
jgi:hypothetical protein